MEFRASFPTFALLLRRECVTREFDSSFEAGRERFSNPGEIFERATNKTVVNNCSANKCSAAVPTKINGKLLSLWPNLTRVLVQRVSKLPNCTPRLAQRFAKCRNTDSLYRRSDTGILITDLCTQACSLLVYLRVLRSPSSVCSAKLARLNFEFWKSTGTRNEPTGTRCRGPLFKYGKRPG